LSAGSQKYLRQPTGVSSQLCCLLPACGNTFNIHIDGCSEGLHFAIQAQTLQNQVPVSYCLFFFDVMIDWARCNDTLGGASSWCAASPCLPGHLHVRQSKSTSGLKKVTEVTRSSFARDEMVAGKWTGNEINTLYIMDGTTICCFRRDRD